MISKNKAASPVIWQKCGGSDTVLLGNTNYAGHSQISDQLAKAITPESVYGGSLIEAATVSKRPLGTSGAEWWPIRTK